jgi:hypothetical protein
MRVAFFEPQKFDTELKGIALKRLKAAAEEIKKEAVSECPVGTISRPMYKTGKYAGQKWTSRDAGRLKGSIRVVTPYNMGKDFSSKTNLRVYAGHYMAWYAAIVEFDKHFMRRAKNRARSRVKKALGIM